MTIKRMEGETPEQRFARQCKQLREAENEYAIRCGRLQVERDEARELVREILQEYSESIFTEGLELVLGKARAALERWKK